jgi:sugar/nucleoside kinase (ribokinase family)
VAEQTEIKWDVLCLGGASADLILDVPQFPERGEKALAKLTGRLPGGLIANAACASARLGLQTAWAGRLGDDESTRLMLEDFTQKGVDTRFAQVVAGAASDFCIILLEPGGERTILVVNTMPGDFPLGEALLRGVANSRLVYTMPYELSWFGQLANCVHASGGQIAIDMEAACPMRGEDLTAALRYCDLVFTTRAGLEMATGVADSVEAAHRLIELGVKLVVATFGAQGSRAFSANETQFSPAFQVPVVDSTGAGDCFHAAFMAEYLRGLPLEACLRFASAAAALSVQKLGARAGLPTQAEVDACLAAFSGGTAREH